MDHGLIRTGTLKPSEENLGVYQGHGKFFLRNDIKSTVIIYIQKN